MVNTPEPGRHATIDAADGVISLDPHGTLRFDAAAELETTTLSPAQRRTRVRVLRFDSTLQTRAA